MSEHPLNRSFSRLTVVVSNIRVARFVLSSEFLDKWGSVNLTLIFFKSFTLSKDDEDFLALKRGVDIVVIDGPSLVEHVVCKIYQVCEQISWWDHLKKTIHCGYYYLFRFLHGREGLQRSLLRLFYKFCINAYSSKAILFFARRVGRLLFRPVSVIDVSEPVIIFSHWDLQSVWLAERLFNAGAEKVIAGSYTTDQFLICGDLKSRFKYFLCQNSAEFEFLSSVQNVKVDNIYRCENFWLSRLRVHQAGVPVSSDAGAVVGLILLPSVQIAVEEQLSSFASFLKGSWDVIDEVRLHICEEDTSALEEKFWTYCKNFEGKVTTVEPLSQNVGLYGDISLASIERGVRSHVKNIEGLNFAICVGFSSYLIDCASLGVQPVVLKASKKMGDTHPGWDEWLNLGLIRGAEGCFHYFISSDIRAFKASDSESFVGLLKERGSSNIFCEEWL